MSDKWKINKEANGGIEGWVAMYKSHPKAPFAYIHEDEAEEIIAILHRIEQKSQLEEIGQAAVEEYQYECACNFPFANRERLKRLKICKAYLARKDG